MDSESIEEMIVSKSSSGNFFPPGFRFHPTDEELVVYYLKRKICCRSIKPDVIAEVDIYKRDPEELPGQSKLKTRDRQWFFFSLRDKKYPNGGRSNRATMHGYWKATGKDRVIKCKLRSVGIKKTLVYHHGRAPAGQRTDWVMHEYTMAEEELKRCPSAQANYALNKVFKKSGPGPKNGEQYGAPFVEEEWDNEDSLDLVTLLVPNVSDDTVEMMNNIRDESDILPPLPQISCVEKSQNMDLVDQTIVNDDFLEMNDIIGPQPAVENFENLVPDESEFACFDGLYEFDLYQDLDMFSEMGQYESQKIQQPYEMNNLEYGTENSGFNSYSNYTGTVVNHQQLHDEHPINYGLWAHDEGNTVSAPSSGVVINENPGKSDSWFSSALWAFVESIPTTPASASEAGAFMNQTFYQNVNKATAAGVNSVLVSRSDKSSRSTRGNTIGT